MTDSDIVRLLKSLDGHRQAIQDIIDTIEASDHPKAHEIAESLYEQCWFPAWPEHVAAPYLDKQRWAFWALSSGSPGSLMSKQQARKRGIEVVEIHD